MCYTLLNLITSVKSISNSQKNFLIYMLKYCDRDGTNIWAATSTIAEDYSLTTRGVIKMRNNVLKDNLMICTKPATSKRPAEYKINTELLQTLANGPVDNLPIYTLRGEHSSGPGVNIVQTTYPITILNTNTVGFNNSVDNFEEQGVAIKHIIDNDVLPCDIIELPSQINLEVISALKTILTEKEGTPLFLEATRCLYNFESMRLAA